MVSEQEFLSLPETMERIELLDGEVIVSPSPTPWHQELLRRLVVALSAWAAEPGHAAFVGLAPLDVRFAPGRILQPDAFVILGSLALERAGPIERVPDLCIEVLSANRAYDRLTKRLVYAEAGVREFWAVEPAGLVERWHGPGLNLRQELETCLRTDVLAGFTLDLVALFRRD